MFDINGGDLGKALKLMLKDNAVVIEWLQSPISYSGSKGFKIELLAS
ncbi:MAG: nucleotidyltransferase domain-containing protein [Pseudomonadota bacterium]